jgi:hypothetical protein
MWALSLGKRTKVKSFGVSKIGSGVWFSNNTSAEYCTLLPAASLSHLTSSKSKPKLGFGVIFSLRTADIAQQPTTVATTVSAIVKRSTKNLECLNKVAQKGPGAALEGCRVSRGTVSEEKRKAKTNAEAKSKRGVTVRLPGLSNRNRSHPPNEDTQPAYTHAKSETQQKTAIGIEKTHI